MLSAEDDLADTIRPRLDAAGADCSRVFALPMLTELDADGRPFRRTPNLAADVDRLDAILEKLQDYRLIVIDPVSAYLGGVDSHKNSDLRAVLSHWAELAARRRVAVVCVSHLNKGAGSAVYRTAGSIAFVAAARAVYAVTKDQNDRHRRLMVPVKMNLASDDLGALAYRVTGNGAAPRIDWEPEPVQVTADQALATPEDESHRTATDEAEEFLRDVLACGPVKAADVQREARQAGISDKALRCARERLGIKPRKRDFAGGWFWGMPSQDALLAPQDAQGAHARKRAPSGKKGILGDDVPPFDDELRAASDVVQVTL